MGSGTPSGEMSVPNNSMFASGILPPNNSICYTSALAAVAANGGRGSEDGPLGFGGNGNSLSDEKLSDKLIQLALYQQFEAPPSSLPNGDTSAARGAFADIDFANANVILFRHIQRLLKDEDQDTIGRIVEDAQSGLDVDAFISFVERAAAFKRNGSDTTAVAESE